MSSAFSIVSSRKIAPSARRGAHAQAIAALEAARKAGVSVTVDCQCDGIFIDGHHSDNGTPTHVPAEIRAALIEHAGELEALLKAAGWWSCGCQGGEVAAS
jgi:hypothetical protein